jgi:hypothetical protein
MKFGPARIWQRAGDGSLDLNASFRVICVYLTIGTFIVIGAGAFASLLHQWIKGTSLDPTPGWLTILQTILAFLFASITGTGFVGVAKAAQAPKLADAEKTREETKVLKVTAATLAANGEQASLLPRPTSVPADTVVRQDAPTRLPPEALEEVSEDDIP